MQVFKLIGSLKFVNGKDKDGTDAPSEDESSFSESYDDESDSDDSDDDDDEDDEEEEEEIGLSYLNSSKIMEDDVRNRAGPRFRMRRITM